MYYYLGSANQFNRRAKQYLLTALLKQQPELLKFHPYDCDQMIEHLLTPSQRQQLRWTVSTADREHFFAQQDWMKDVEQQHSGLLQRPNGQVKIRRQSVGAAVPQQT